ncbi:LLM class flavin-dependent oxidoreductase [Flavobacteriaceae bacterium]|jgi:alkanesulfonate monooxygenase|nr:LLM class flavin-dependent oxidoreductase [Flavobacteriaceae bacterium]MDA9330374.1 LLM class flavin-dependent oxidoreductase [bacterium]MDA9317976.1 LLM class flavin-dependent oxidoreductase [Flavobacteriaceae bacterium]MDA9323934.1 LLM class flavin-dependent oxidoreductase [Flavobacteriaceae bacterium]MDB4093588.1 LLM class flavin-dependent oxidoreductase [Flavobacteriaceae bacterium]|tara:strand:- start:1764 stop:2891 length:1128 start_codon:yes stop_codon:yes gene_type:complete
MINDVEISWFAPICDGDDDILGSRNPKYKSTWENTSRIIKTADELGYTNVLCPSSYQVGQDTLTYVSAMATLTKQINFLAAIRCGEVHPPMLARAIATLDHILKGRLTINIISSDLPGNKLESSKRYARSREVIEILKQAWTKDEINFQGDFYKINLPSAPVKPYQQNGGPLLYFGGYSPDGVDLCAEHCDVYLMWPDTEDKLQILMSNMRSKALVYNRTVEFGLRVHVIVRESQMEARDFANKLISNLDFEIGEDIKNRAQDAKSLGVSMQSSLRIRADKDYYVESNLWTGIGLARSGCGAAIVGDPDQVYNKLKRYVDMGIKSFILSGYPHQDECELFAKYVLPRFNNIHFSKKFNRTPKSNPDSPLGNGLRK